MVINEQNINQQDLVSVIIPCYNHGKYLSCAIESVLTQDHKDVEIIVVDDGSTDTTKEMAHKFPTVIYIYQPNSGLSAARNTGIENSKGNYLIFLDADDWLMPHAISTNLNILKLKPEVVFVSGAHDVVYEYNNKVETTCQLVNDHHYQHLLQGNYIGMHATVMYRRCVFDQNKYDTSLTACEDYDLYLRIARKNPVLHHSNKIAAYRIHHTNMSGNIPLMYEKTIQVLKKQQPFIQTQDESQSLQEGLANWKNYYTKETYLKLYYLPLHFNPQQQALRALLLRNNRRLYLKYVFTKTLETANRCMKKIKTFTKNNLPDLISRRLHKTGIYKKFIPAVGNINLGDFGRTTPFSKEFGYDRGGPVDRYYIERFLKNNETSIKGNVLEIGDNEYTLKYGGSRITKSEILHIDETNINATIIGDLSNAPHIPNEQFDTIILTQTLHLIYDFHAAIATCYRILKNGGTLLITVPGISHIDQGEWKNNWLWSFTQASLTKILSNVFQKENTEVETFGNVLAASAFLYGMGQKEVDKKYLDVMDPHYQLIIAAKAVKR